jgi:hypothetical protein
MNWAQENIQAGSAAIMAKMPETASQNGTTLGSALLREHAVGAVWATGAGHQS